MSFPSDGRRVIFLISPLICIFLLSSSLHAQRHIVDNVPEGPVRFYLDSANFYDPISRAGQLVIFYKVANDHLQFVKEQGGYRATFQIVCVVDDDKGHQVTGDVISSSQRVKTFDETNSNEEFVQGHIQFPLVSGEYRIRVWIEDRLGNEMVHAEDRVTMRSFDGPSLMLSDLLLATEIWPQGDLEQGFERNGQFLMPSVEHSFNDAMPLLSCYFEIYDLEAEAGSESLHETKFEIINSSGEMVKSDSGSVAGLGQLSFSRWVFPVDTLDEDQYLLRLTVSDPRKRRTAQSQVDFMVRWSALGHVAKDYAEAVEQLRYIASEAEYKELKSAQGEKRKEAWLKFWDDRDPTPGTPTNEMKIEYYRRIEYANSQFSVVSPGWKTDRGRIYIIYGPPDDIERHPMDIELKPYQIWHYYSSNRLFYFIDEDGYGDYKLVAWR